MVGAATLKGSKPCGKRALANTRGIGIGASCGRLGRNWKIACPTWRPFRGWPVINPGIVIDITPFLLRIMDGTNFVHPGVRVRSKEAPFTGPRGGAQGSIRQGEGKNPYSQRSSSPEVEALAAAAHGAKPGSLAFRNGSPFYNPSSPLNFPSHPTFN